MTSWTREALTHETMVRQGLATRRSVGVTDAVRSVLALQAQEPAAPYLALWNRIEHFDPADLDRALADGAIVKASLFRFTLHAVAADDIAWVRAAMQSRVIDAGYRGILEEVGLTADRLDELLERLSAVMALPHDNTEMERVLTELVPESGDHARLWSALRVVAFRHAPTADLWSFGRRPAFLPCTVAHDDEPAAVAELVRRYLMAFGPATLADMAGFTILKRSTLRQSVASMDDVVAVPGPKGSQLLDLWGNELRPDAERSPLPPRLLGMWDSVLLAYEDRSRVIPDEHRPHVIRRNGDVLPTVLVDGLVVVSGGLRPTRSRSERWNRSTTPPWTIWTTRRVTCDASWPTGNPRCSPDSDGGGIACPTARRSRSDPELGRPRHRGAWSRARHATSRRMHEACVSRRRLTRSRSSFGSQPAGADSS